MHDDGTGQHQHSATTCPCQAVRQLMARSLLGSGVLSQPSGLISGQIQLIQRLHPESDSSYQATPDRSGCKKTSPTMKTVDSRPHLLHTVRLFLLRRAPTSRHIADRPTLKSKGVSRTNLSGKFLTEDWLASRKAFPNSSMQSRST